MGDFVSIKLITFDVYSALLDVDNGLIGNLQEILSLPLIQAKRMAKLWRSKQLERACLSNSLGIGRTSFQECTRQSLVYVCELENVKIDSELSEKLVASWNSLPPWPEANDALQTIENSGYDLAILSNGDIEMLTAISKSFNVKFKFIFSSETVGFYKPHKSVYHLPQKIAGISPEQTIHIAGGANDVLGAGVAGLNCIWSNKNNDSLLDVRYPAMFEISDLSKLDRILKQVISKCP